MQIPLFIICYTLISMQSIQSMEKESTKYSLLIPKRKKSTDSPTQKTSLITGSYSKDEEKEEFQTKSSKSKKYVRSKTVDGTSGKPKEHTIINLFSLSDSASSLLKKSPRQKTSPLSVAIQNYDLETINLHIKNPNTNLNEQDEWGNTLLHRTVIKLTEPKSDKDTLQKIITLLLTDSRTDTSITRGLDNRQASQMLSGGDDPTMRQLLFARATLDIQTNHEIGKMLLKSYINNIPLDDKLIKQTIECITQKIKTTEKVQETGERALPENAKLPEYATDEFIFEMIKKRIPIESEQISEAQKIDLKKVFIQEIQAILLNVSIDFNEESIQESIETICKHITMSHEYLAQFITKPCIFEILKDELSEHKEKNKVTLSTLSSKTIL